MNELIENTLETQTENLSDMEKAERVRGLLKEEKFETTLEYLGTDIGKVCSARRRKVQFLLDLGIEGVSAVEMYRVIIQSFQVENPTRLTEIGKLQARIHDALVEKDFSLPIKKAQKIKKQKQQIKNSPEMEKVMLVQKFIKGGKFEDTPAYPGKDIKEVCAANRRRVQFLLDLGIAGASAFEMHGVVVKSTQAKNLIRLSKTTKLQIKIHDVLEQKGIFLNTIETLKAPEAKPTKVKPKPLKSILPLNRISHIPTEREDRVNACRYLMSYIWGQHECLRVRHERGKLESIERECASKSLPTTIEGMSHLCEQGDEKSLEKILDIYDSWVQHVLLMESLMSW